jgi:hypothetical protein
MGTRRFSGAFWQLAGSFALGVGLVTLGLLGLLALALVLPPANARAHPHDHEAGDRAAGDGERREGRPFRWSGEIARGGTLEVSGIHGNIRISPARGRRLVVEARKSGRRSDPESVEIEVRELPGGVTICARYPRPDGGLNECGERQEVRDNDVAVHFDVGLPAGVHVAARTVNGGIEAQNLGGDVRATTVNGSVALSTTGVASAESVNGSVVARLGRLDQDLDFTTVNGRLRVILPRGANARVDARTMNGSISTDFPLTVKGRWGNRRMSGTIGRGGPEVRLETVNGAIELRSAAGRVGRERDDDRDDEDEKEGEVQN